MLGRSQVRVIRQCLQCISLFGGGELGVVVG